ncbi:hypothetical protein bpr_I0371 [Butyrivibrio proteoclasticus B316]|uniref:Uncharacterized protein n=1 Tax=Butyrivibrio proteoclasticus (strain ATCC 51982 / DSM 14932 / B316) TaxID=515622 RepID=E0RZC2_BUTPB|nr:hypothetical protein bpr_I0371 [Butyrivibrio proteoclasticus B316]
MKKEKINTKYSTYVIIRREVSKKCYSFDRFNKYIIFFVIYYYYIIIVGNFREDYFFLMLFFRKNC